MRNERVEDEVRVGLVEHFAEVQAGGAVLRETPVPDPGGRRAHPDWESCG